MKSNLSIAILSGVLLTITLIPPVMAAPQKLTEMTCEEFSALDNEIKPKVVYWVDGFRKKGLPVVAEVDIDKTDQLITVLIAECKETPSASFWEKITSYL